MSAPDEPDYAEVKRGLVQIAQIAQVSGRLLRYYDELGLLSPVRIDPQTGYLLVDGCRPREGEAREELFIDGTEPPSSSTARSTVRR